MAELVEKVRITNSTDLPEELQGVEVLGVSEQGKPIGQYEDGTEKIAGKGAYLLLKTLVSLGKAEEIPMATETAEMAELRNLVQSLTEQLERERQQHATHITELEKKWEIERQGLNQKIEALTVQVSSLKSAVEDLTKKMDGESDAGPKTGPMPKASPAGGPPADYRDEKRTEAARMRAEKTVKEREFNSLKGELEPAVGEEALDDDALRYIAVNNRYEAATERITDETKRREKEAEDEANLKVERGNIVNRRLESLSEADKDELPEGAEEKYDRYLELAPEAIPAERRRAPRVRAAATGTPVTPTVRRTTVTPAPAVPPSRRRVVEEEIWYRRPVNWLGGLALAAVLTSVALGVWNHHELEELEHRKPVPERVVPNPHSIVPPVTNGSTENGYHMAWYRGTTGRRLSGVWLPKNVNLTGGPGSYRLVDSDGKLLANHVQWDSQGKLTRGTMATLRKNVNVGWAHLGVGYRFVTTVANR